jgi:hypothetical protein
MQLAKAPPAGACLLRRPLSLTCVPAAWLRWYCRYLIVLHRVNLEDLFAEDDDE